jgi:hypothetical protein
MDKLISIFLSMLGPSQVCGEPEINGYAYIEDANASCAEPTNHVCNADEWPNGWEVAVCCTSTGCRFSPEGVCVMPESPVCGFIPQPEPEPWVCSSLGSLVAYVSEDASCDVGELHVCTYGETPANPFALVCCTDSTSCRLAPGNESCDVGEWLACSHDG